MKMTTTTMRRRFSAAKAALAVAVSAALLVSCSNGASSEPDETANAEALKPFHVLSVPVAHFAHAFMALEQGYFEEEGLDVTIQSFPSGTTALETFKQGIDGREGFGEVILSGAAPAVSFWGQSDDKYRAIAEVERNSEGYVAVARADVKQASDLVGQKVGYREKSTSELFLRTYFAENGLSLDDVELVNLDQAAMVSALDQGDIAAFFLFEPAGRLSVETSGDSVHYLTTGADFFESSSVAGTWQHVIDERPDDIAAFLRALIKGQEYVKSHPEETAELYARDFNVAKEGVLADLEILNLMVGLDAEFVSTTEEQAGEIAAWGGRDREFDFWSFASPCSLVVADSSRVDPDAPSC